MQYDASTAPFEVGDLLFIMPHLAIGVVLLFAAISGRCWLRGLSGKVGLTIQGAAGLLFFGLASFVIVRNSVDTLRCREAFADGKTSHVEGALVITKRFVKPGHGYILFKVGDRSFKTETLGTSCDCGFVRPVGRTTNLQEAADVEVEVFEGAVVRLRSKGPA